MFLKWSLIGLSLVVLGLGICCVNAAPQQGAAANDGASKPPACAETCTENSGAYVEKSQPESKKPSPKLSAKEEVSSKLKQAFMAWENELSKLTQLEQRFTAPIKEGAEESALKQSIQNFSGALEYHELCAEYQRVKARLKVLREEIVQLKLSYHEENLAEYAQTADAENEALTEMLEQESTSASESVEESESEKVASPAPVDIRAVSLCFESADFKASCQSATAIELALETAFKELRSIAARQSAVPAPATLEARLDAAALKVDREEREFMIRLLLRAEQQKQRELERFLDAALEGPCGRIDLWVQNKILAKKA